MVRRFDPPQARGARSRFPCTMRWLPSCPDFRERLDAARRLAEPAERLAVLEALSRTRLGYLETIQLDRAVAAMVDCTATDHTRLRVAVLSDTTVDHLTAGIRVSALRRRLLVDIRVGQFGQYRQEALDPRSWLAAFAPDVVLLSLSARSLVESTPLAATEAVVGSAVSTSIDDLRNVWRALRTTHGAVVAQQTYLDVYEPVFGGFDAQIPAAPSQLVRALNLELVQAAQSDAVLVVDAAGACARDGIDAWFDPGRWLHGKLEVAPQAASPYGELVARVLAAQRGLSRKCLVLDLDNTLWGGVVGEVGVEGIVLGPGSAQGEAHLALQRYAKRLADRGIVLAVCSKNEPALAEAAFHEHPEMLLRRSDIAAFVANWTDKATNLRAIARQLNIGLDSLVFVDDNPAERARVRESLPTVAVPELPDDPALYVRTIADAGYFEAVAFTAEDRERTHQYMANAQREAERGASQTMEEFLQRLAMTVTFGPVTPVDTTRVAQLLNKTNQFNTTTRRYSADEVAVLVGGDQRFALQFRLLDRFGDNGLVSVMVLAQDADEPREFDLENWVMSCRVFGRQLEFEAMNILVEALRSRGVRALRATYRPTERNGVVRDLYASLGFTPAPVPAAEDGASHWQLRLSEYAGRETFIAREGQLG